LLDDVIRSRPEERKSAHQRWGTHQAARDGSSLKWWPNR
jgi:hypothetical protein